MFPIVEIYTCNRFISIELPLKTVKIYSYIKMHSHWVVGRPLLGCRLDGFGGGGVFALCLIK